MPDDVRGACTGVPVVDQAVRVLYATGSLHNHARLWLASYLVHLRKVHWRAGADWLYGHLLDGDLASNHLSWQWVAGTGSSKPYLFDAANVARFAPSDWHSPGSVVDTDRETLERWAREPGVPPRLVATGCPATDEPAVLAAPPATMGAQAPDAAAVAGRDVWLVHPWSLGRLPRALPADVLVLGLFVADFHRAWPWNARRWDFVGRRMADLTAQRWHGGAGAIGAALQAARSVGSIDEPHLAPWLAGWATCRPAPALFPPQDRRCDSFSMWWARVSRGRHQGADWLTPDEYHP